MTLANIMVAPNGARLMKSDHPSIPLSLPDILHTAKACADAGADGLHLHIRDENGAHLLSTTGYDAATDALAEACPTLKVQITTEAVGQYAPLAQREIALKTKAKSVSVSVREIMRDPDHAASFYAQCRAAGKDIQHILYDGTDAALLQSILSPEALHDPALQLLFVLGRYTTGQRSEPSMLDPFLEWLEIAGLSPDWALCAFGPSETDCLLYGRDKGGKCRIGFENNLYMRDGRLALNNAERVSELVSLLADH